MFFYEKKEIKEIELDLTPFICEAFASNPNVHKTIEKIYEKNRLQYYQLAKANKWYNHEFITSQSIFKEITMKRALAILLEGDQEKITQIIRTGWKSLFDIIKKQETINLTEIMDKISPSIEKFDTLTNDEINSYVIITLITASLLGKKINTNDHFYKVVIDTMLVHLEWAEGQKYRFSLQAMSHDNRKKLKKFKERLYKEADINKYWTSHAKTKIPEMLDFYVGFSYIFDTEKLSSSIIEDEPLSEKDIEEILAAYFLTHQNLNKIEAAKFLAAGHIIKSLLRAYRHLKEEHFKTSRETLYLDLDTAKHEAKEAKSETKKLEWTITQKNKEINDLKKQVSNEYSRAVNEYKEKIKAIEKQNIELNQKIAQMEKELEELRNIIFIEQPYKEIKEDVDLSIKGVIVGGHKNWHNKMREILPSSWYFIHPDDNFDLAIITNADIVFFYTNYLNHVIFNSVIAEIRRREIPVGYLKRISVKDCLKDIQAIVQKNSN